MKNLEKPEKQFNLLECNAFPRVLTSKNFHLRGSSFISTVLKNPDLDYIDWELKNHIVSFSNELTAKTSDSSNRIEK
uniref:Uncharacterized protein n=1 Tax=Romanomermis culicivorax TaxID=13658 RepID=A0A915J6C7_ROMCU